MDFKTRLRQLRWDADLSQEEIAKHFGVTRACLSRWENGKAFPEKKYLVPLANYFHVTLDYLLGSSDFPTVKDAAIDSIESDAKEKGYMIIPGTDKLTDSEKNQIIAFANFIKASHGK